MDEQVPVILCSSKTASEMDDIQQELGLGGLPYIAENGAVIQPDVRWENAARFISEKKHDEIRQCIARVRQAMHLKFTTFDDVDERVVAEWTGLSRPRSVLARKHEASVTLIWRDSDEQMARFAAELARQGLKIVQEHASGISSTPAAAKTWRFTGLWTSIACTRVPNRRRWARATAPMMPRCWTA